MIEELSQEDSHTIIDYLKQYFNSDYSDLNPFEKILVYKKEKILGFISYSMIYERAELNYLFVLPEFRNKKIASFLMEAMFSDLQKNNVDNITLEVKENNESAIKLYFKYGFQKVAIRKQYYGTTNAILMEKELGD